MPRKRNLLHVRGYIEWVIESIDDMLLRDESDKPPKFPGSVGLIMPSIDQQNLKEIRFFGKAILRKHPVTKTNRKDIYVERRDSKWSNQET